MLRLPSPELLPNDLTSIANLQAEIDQGTDYETRVNTAKVRFASKPKALFQRIRKALEITSGDLVRCGYCEDSCADEVEHVWPKDFYPNLAFSHLNYLFSCGRCNIAKSNKFSIWEGRDWLDLRMQRKTYGFIEPVEGEPRFINPLDEQPLDYLWLDFAGETFRFTALADEGTEEYDRANFTIETLGLNRGVLVRARENAYSGFLDRMRLYLDCKNSGKDQGEIDSRLRELRRSPHQTVRHEIGRQVAVTPLPQDILSQCPELFED